MRHTDGNAGDTGSTVVDADSTVPMDVSLDYVMRVHRCEAGFTVTLRACAGGPRGDVDSDAGPLATGVAATAGEAMVAAIAGARIPASPGPLTVGRSVEEFDPPTLWAPPGQHARRGRAAAQQEGRRGA